MYAAAAAPNTAVITARYRRTMLPPAEAGERRNRASGTRNGKETAPPAATGENYDHMIEKRPQQEAAMTGGAGHHNKYHGDRHPDDHHEGRAKRPVATPRRVVATTTATVNGADQPRGGKHGVDSSQSLKTTTTPEKPFITTGGDMVMLPRPKSRSSQHAAVKMANKEAYWRRQVHQAKKQAAKELELRERAEQAADAAEVQMYIKENDTVRKLSNKIQAQAKEIDSLRRALHAGVKIPGIKEKRHRKVLRDGVPIAIQHQVPPRKHAADSPRHRK